MAYVGDNENIDGVKFVLTEYGKQKSLERGLLNVIKYFTVSDDGLMYSSNTNPTQLKDINGSHLTSTNKPDVGTNIIKK